MKRCRQRHYLFGVSVILCITVLSVAGSAAFAADLGPLSHKGDRRCGINFGYGYSFESNRDVRFASIYPYLGYTLTDPVGSGIFRGAAEAILEGTFSYVFKDQNKYAAGFNAGIRYNFLPDSQHLRPFIQGALGITVTNLDMHHFGSNFNFSSNASCGLQYFFDDIDAISIEYRFFHVSNAGIDDDNSGLNMSNIFIGFSRKF